MIVAELMIAAGGLYIGAKFYQKRRKKKRPFLQPAPHQSTQLPFMPLLMNGTAKTAIQRYLTDTVLPVFGKTRRQQLTEISSEHDQRTNKEVDKKINRNLTIASVSVVFSAISGLGFSTFSLLSLSGFFFISSFGFS